ncbi:WXG100 family type VII secretion target [Saccharopolyspora sp. K220]|uniref:WXG100 family type VII secretion target n=1 Tax=Saccharopolyspora soli TaxID=2926618 RepID=UPI001F5AE573|nr:WXG100 family type VII secretion target [Saccharopolyspora soli]MCI2419498.1 WXG100 family type VII secretion target [Saccharopolyspora soli]
MANPMEMATPGFWEAVRNFDKIVDETGVKVRKLLPQFELIGKVDTGKIKDVAKNVWGESETTGGVRTDIATSHSSVADAKSYIENGWKGEAFIAFNSAADKAKNALDDVSEPLAELSKALTDMADKFEQSVGDVMTTIAGIGGILTAIGGILTALLVAPEPVVTKVIGIIVAIVGALVALVAYAGAQIKAVEDRQKAAEAVVNECTVVMRTIKN